MMKRAALLVLGVFLLLNMSGCFLLLAGAAGGAGTAAWLSGKLTQDVNVSYERAVNAAKNGLQALQLAVTKETREANVTQLKSQYHDGKDIWVDIRKTTDSSSKIEVRVGGISGDKQAADKVMKSIIRYL